MEPEDRRPPKKAEGRSMPVPEPGAVLLPGYRVQLQLGADLLPLCRATEGRRLAGRRLSRIGRGPNGGKEGGREGVPEERPRHGLAGYLERSSISPGHISPGPAPNLVTPPRPTGKISPTAICS